MLSCDDCTLRADVTQRQNHDVLESQFLASTVEKQLSQLFFKEVRYHLKAD
jgi:hypothetical protein